MTAAMMAGAPTRCSFSSIAMFDQEIERVIASLNGLDLASRQVNELRKPLGQLSDIGHVDRERAADLNDKSIILALSHSLLLSRLRRERRMS